MRLDWVAMRRAGLCELRLTPAEFWALTPAEFLLLLGVTDRSSPMGRAGLEELCDKFPDTMGEEST